MPSAKFNYRSHPTLQKSGLVLSPDQITAIAPDASSLKAGRDLGTPRKWELLGGDAEVLWGLAMGSGKLPYQTQVCLTDLASKCSCPSRKFPCKHAIGLMFLATNSPAALVEKSRPPWTSEWLEGRSTRVEKAAAKSDEKAAKPIDEKAAEKRRAKRESRVNEGISLLQQNLLDLTREGLASGNARSPSAWENLAKRMVDSQAPGIAGNLRHIADTVLRDPDVDSELPLELGRLHLMLHAIMTAPPDDKALLAELQSLIGGRADAEFLATGELVDDDWFVAGRRLEERDRLITSMTWMLGAKSRRWARVLRFAPAPQTIVEPWPVGVTVPASFRFYPGLYPLRVTPENEGTTRLPGLPEIRENSLESLLERFSSAISQNPFLRSVPFLMPLCPARDSSMLVDDSRCALRWDSPPDMRLRVDSTCGGRPTPMCGEWDGRSIRLLAIWDHDAWFSLTPRLT